MHKMTEISLEQTVAWLLPDHPIFFPNRLFIPSALEMLQVRKPHHSAELALFPFDIISTCIRAYLHYNEFAACTDHNKPLPKYKEVFFSEAKLILCQPILQIIWYTPSRRRGMQKPCVKLKQTHIMENRYPKSRCSDKSHKPAVRPAGQQYCCLSCLQHSPSAYYVVWCQKQKHAARRLHQQGGGGQPRADHHNTWCGMNAAWHEWIQLMLTWIAKFHEH